MGRSYRLYNPEFYERVMAKRLAGAVQERIDRDRRWRREKHQDERASTEGGTTDPRQANARDTAKQRAKAIDCGPLAREIIAEVAHRHRITFADVIGSSRKKDIVRARTEAIRKVADAKPDWSMGHIGRIFGGRDHTTILWALKKTGKPGEHWRRKSKGQA